MVKQKPVLEIASLNPNDAAAIRGEEPKRAKLAKKGEQKGEGRHTLYPLANHGPLS